MNEILEYTCPACNTPSILCTKDLEGITPLQCPKCGSGLHRDKPRPVVPDAAWANMGIVTGSCMFMAEHEMGFER